MKITQFNMSCTRRKTATQNTIEAYRKKHKLSHEALSLQTGYSIEHLQSLEAPGGKEPDLSEIETLSRAFNEKPFSLIMSMLGEVYEEESLAA